MGCFAFECLGCGKHEQEGIVQGCVMKVGRVWVRGEYSDYGWASCRQEGSDQEVQVWFERFAEYFEAWGVAESALKASHVYCSDAKRNGVPRDVRRRVLHVLPAL
mmetsp:Transcript_8962/g.28442  ORF Transcript_8962/g.28442 Transcript_8962/m.28442 type:complete len:105 (+) Transcript_8962:51-365(+)